MTCEKIDAPEITDLDITRYYNLIKGEHQEHLSDKGVKMPNRNKLKSKCCSGAFLQLLVLRKYIGKFVSKQGLSEAVRDKNAKLKFDQQARHLGTQRGFNVLCGGEVIPGTDERVPQGYYILISMTEPKPGFSFLKRDAVTPPPKYKDGDLCANCFAIHGKCHPKYPSKVVKLEAGHRDPNKPLLGDNIIPQCQHCNRTTKDSIIWGSGEHPLPIALNNTTLVMASSIEIQKSIYDKLHEKFKVEK